MIGVAWRGGDPWRERLWHHVEARLHRTGMTVRTADSGAEPFSRAESFNLLVQHSDDPVVILQDADLLIPLDAYEPLARLALDSGALVIGYTEYRALGERSTRQVLNGANPWTAHVAGITEGWSQGGICAITVDAWNQVGGMDPRFRGWGCEDWAFSHACRLVLGPVLRAPNPAVHLWHQRAEGTNPDAEGRNSRLMAEYTACATVDELRALQGVNHG